jgi:hypothetical protein
MGKKIGFTGHRELTPAQERKVINRCNQIIKEDNAELYITGACTGVHALVALHMAENHPEIQQLIIVPAKRTFVDERVLRIKDALITYMPKASSYRERNERIVFNSSRLEAFWNGSRRNSGTYMTINIAKYKGIPITRTAI